MMDTISKRSKTSALHVVLLGGLPWLIIATSAWADSGCETIRGDAELTSVPGGPFEGPAWLLVGENLLYSQVLVLGTGAKVTEDGTVVGTTRITFDFGDGNSFVLGNDRFALDPTAPGEFRLTDHGRITEGTEMFGDAFGRVMLQGIVSFSATGEGNAILTIKGQVCNVSA